ncbi:MAG: galactokinase, partial [Rubrobacter sp.]
EAPRVVASAPGRINLIGEHTDYNGGFVLPCAIDRRIAVAVSTGGRGGFETLLYSADFDETRRAGEKDSSWADYPRGVAWAMREGGHDVGHFEAAFAGDVPLGSGLSSSAAIEAATALALDDLFGIGLGRKDLAVICQRAENDYVGVASGIMDQYASLLCESGAALLVDCRSLEARSVPLDLPSAGLVLIVCDTRVERGLADTGYNDRRATCERAASTLGVEELRDATEVDLQLLSGEELKRARHIVYENARVLEAVEALKNRDFDGFGRLMYASHASLRDDYEVSTRELDTFVEKAKEHGAKGARLTGAGFGGCAIALVQEGETAALTEACGRAFAQRGFEKPAFYEFVPAAGAELVE